MSVTVSATAASCSSSWSCSDALMLPSCRVPSADSHSGLGCVGPGVCLFVRPRSPAVAPDALAPRFVGCGQNSKQNGKLIFSRRLYAAGRRFTRPMLCR